MILIRPSGPAPTASSGGSTGSVFCGAASSSDDCWLPRSVVQRARSGSTPGPTASLRVSWPPTDLHFSTASTEALALIAIARVPVGIDCEQVRADRVSAAAAEIFLTADEFASWSGLSWPSRIIAFFVAWTRKEALVKASGLGLGGCPPDRLDVTFDPPANLATFLPRQGFIASLATEVDPR